jgi:hypothetical protein
MAGDGKVAELMIDDGWMNGTLKDGVGIGLGASKMTKERNRVAGTELSSGATVVALGSGPVLAAQIRVELT